MNLEELKTAYQDTSELLELYYDYNYLLRNKYDQLLADYIVEKIGIHSVVRPDGVIFYHAGNEFCWLRFKTLDDYVLCTETIIEDSFYLHGYSFNAQVKTEAVDVLIIIGKLAQHLDTIVAKYLETVDRAKQNYELNKRDTSELRKKLLLLKEQYETMLPKKKAKKK